MLFSRRMRHGVRDGCNCSFSLVSPRKEAASVGDLVLLNLNFLAGAGRRQGSGEAKRHEPPPDVDDSNRPVGRWRLYCYSSAARGRLSLMNGNSVKRHISQAAGVVMSMAAANRIAARARGD